MDSNLWLSLAREVLKVPDHPYVVLEVVDEGLVAVFNQELYYSQCLCYATVTLLTLMPLPDSSFSTRNPRILDQSSLRHKDVTRCKKRWLSDA